MYFGGSHRASERHRVKVGLLIQRQALNHHGISSFCVLADSLRNLVSLQIPNAKVLKTLAFLSHLYLESLLQWK